MKVKLCPHLKFVKSDFKAYKEAATQVRAFANVAKKSGHTLYPQVRDILREYDPQFESYSLDEVRHVALRD